MNADPIDRLLAEHREFRPRLGALRDAVVALAASGGAALAGTRPAFDGAAELFAGPLLAHARREDEALFPALAAALGGPGPTEPFRDEHRRIHAQAERFRAALARLERVERLDHAALARAGTELAGLLEGHADGPSLVTVGEEILQLLEDHFVREESMLFPMARQVLAPAALAAVSRAMDELGA